MRYARLHAQIIDIKYQVPGIKYQVEYVKMLFVRLHTEGASQHYFVVPPVMIRTIA